MTSVLQVNQFMSHPNFWASGFHLPETIPEFPLNLIIPFFFFLCSFMYIFNKDSVPKIAQFSCFSHENISMLYLIFMLYL